MQLDMEKADWNPRKPYDLRERLFEFGCLIIRLVQYLHAQGPVAVKLSEQILKAGTSAPANYEEADDATGERDKRAKRMIALRELKEARILAAEHDPVIDESDELIRILATVIRKSEGDN
jgi:four helix bundle protein